jgi:hypothetical protein
MPYNDKPKFHLSIMTEMFEALFAWSHHKFSPAPEVQPAPVPTSLQS